VGVLGGTPGGQVPLVRPPASLACLRLSDLAEELLAAGEAAGLVERVAGGGSGGRGSSRRRAASVRVNSRLMKLMKKGSKRGAGAAVKQRAKAAAGPAGGEAGPSLLQRRLAGFATWWLAQQLLLPGGERPGRTALQNRLTRLCGSRTRAQALLALLEDPLWAVVEEGEDGALALL
jgi:hypothetical protein